MIYEHLHMGIPCDQDLAASLNYHSLPENGGWECIGFAVDMVLPQQSSKVLVASQAPPQPIKVWACVLRRLAKPETVKGWRRGIQKQAEEQKAEQQRLAQLERREELLSVIGNGEGP